VTAELAVFITMGAAAAVTASAVVLSKNTVHAVIYLVMNLFSIAVLYLALSAQMVAFLQIIIYAGAIMVLFLFTVMMLNMTGAVEAAEDRLLKQKPLAAALGLMLIAEVVMGTVGLFSKPSGSMAIEDGFGSAGEVGSRLFFGYMLPFEVTSILLLAAIVGSVVLARKKDEE